MRGEIIVLYTEIQTILDKLPGKIGVYYRDLRTGNSFSFNDQERFIAASVIKLPILIAVLYEIHTGNLRREDTVQVSPEDKVPGCGVLTLMHDGLEITIKDLCNLMITISDNTATNILIDYLGVHRISQILQEFGIKNTTLARKLYDMEGKRQGKENYICPAEIGVLLEKIYAKDIISEEICLEITETLKLQQLNSKIPHLLPNNIEIAHKTGEIDGLTHDVGIVFAEKPFVLCFASSETDVVLAEEAIREIALRCYNHSLK